MKYDSRGKIAEIYELLCTDKPDEERLQDMLHARGLAYRTKTIKSGGLLEIMCYPILTHTASARAKKQKASDVRQRQRNEERSVRQFIRMAEANFTDRDYFFTGTFEGENLPNLKDTQKYFDRFKRRLNRLRPKFGLSGNMRILSVYEGKEDGDGKKRIHVHMLMDGDLPRDAVENEWTAGFANTKRIQKSGEGSLTGLAKYMAKQVRGHYERRWTATRNLKRPKESVADRKVSSHRAWILASKPDEARRVLEERLYPGYKIEDEISVRASEFLPGARIYIRMRLKSQQAGEARFRACNGR